jgi:hypothetical protein
LSLLKIMSLKQCSSRKKNERYSYYPGRPSSDTHDQIRKITLKTTTAKTRTFNRKKFGICLREKTMIDYVICTVIPKVIITWYHTCHTVGLTGWLLNLPIAEHFILFPKFFISCENYVRTISLIFLWRQYIWCLFYSIQI